MAIIYYPGRIYKGKVPAIDRVMAKRKPISVMGAQNTTSTALDIVVSAQDAWQVDSIGLEFSNTTARDFSAYIMNGRAVVQNLNDYLWFHVTTTLPQKIILSSGFYTGTELATELQSKLNANTAYVAKGITFTVVYNVATGIYTITPSSQTIAYLNVNTAQVLSQRDSIAGHLFGLNTTTAFASNVASDASVIGLDAEIAIINQSSSSATSYLHDTVHILSVDQAVHLTSNVGADVTVTYNVVYEEIV